MPRAVVFVLSSAWEGLPGVRIEALVAGCPAVNPDYPSGPAYVPVGGAWMACAGRRHTLPYAESGGPTPGL